MKILHIGQLIGGLDSYIRNSITNINDEFVFIVIHGQGDNSAPIRHNGKRVKEYHVKLFRQLNLLNDFTCIFQTICIIKKEKPDIIHCHSAKGGLVGRISGFITHTRTLYTPHAFSFLSSDNWIRKTVYLFVERFLKLNSYLLACSESEQKIAMNKVGYKKQKALLWANAVPDVLKIAKDKSRNIEKKFICYIGRPSYQKNPFLLIPIVQKVINQIPNFRIYLLGVGYHSPDLGELERMICKYKLSSNIILIPWLTQIEVQKYIAQSFFYISVSRYEGLPLSVLEAMSLGKALIVSNVPGNIDCVENKKNGYVLPLDSQLFAEKIIELWNSKEKREHLGMNSRKKYLKKFDIEKQIKILESTYRTFRTL